jgi:hypothetical protein
MANDIPTYDAAYGAAIASAATFSQDAVTADYTQLKADATAFATQVDATIFAGGGAGANANRANLMQAICFAYMGSRNILNTGATPELPSANPASDPASYAGVADAINAIFQVAKTGLL